MGVMSIQEAVEAGSGQRYQILWPVKQVKKNPAMQESHVIQVKKQTAMQESHKISVWFLHKIRVWFLHSSQFFDCSTSKMCDPNHIPQATAYVEASVTNK